MFKYFVEYSIWHLIRNPMIFHTVQIADLLYAISASKICLCQISQYITNATNGQMQHLS